MGQGTPSVFSRGGTLLPSLYADARAMLMPSLFQRFLHKSLCVSADMAHMSTLSSSMKFVLSFYQQA